MQETDAQPTKPRGGAVAIRASQAPTRSFHHKWLGGFLLGSATLMLGIVLHRLAPTHETALAESERWHDLESLCVRQQAALEVGDRVVQGACAAKWLIELGLTEKALDALNALVADSGGLAEALPPDQRLLPTRQNSCREHTPESQDH